MSAQPAKTLRETAAEFGLKSDEYDLIVKRLNREPNLGSVPAFLNPPVTTEPTGRVALVRFVLVGLLAALASIRLWKLPLTHDDQALFTVGASILNAGGVLYIGHSERVTGPAAQQLQPAGLTTYVKGAGA